LVSFKIANAGTRTVATFCDRRNSERLMSALTGAAPSCADPSTSIAKRAAAQ